MPLTYSKMLPLGTKAPNFRLKDVCDHQNKSLHDVMGPKGLLVMFICNHCPFVQHIWPQLNQVARAFQAQGIGVVAIASNDVALFPEDGPDKMAEEARAQGFSYPYLFDETQAVAKLYQAECTPDFFLFDAQSLCYYRGQFDAARPGNQEPVTGVDLQTAAMDMLQGKPAPENQKPSAGCNIKWKRSA